jgi:hypothetical protein
MAGELVPLVMIPRYTTYAGAKPDDGFTTVGMDVTNYDSAILNIWRGQIIATGGTPAFKVNCEESTDQNVWSACEGTSVDEAILEDTEEQIVAQLNKRWFRIRISVAGTAPVVSCWAVGYLEQRLR